MRYNTMADLTKPRLKYKTSQDVSEDRGYALPIAHHATLDLRDAATNAYYIYWFNNTDWKYRDSKSCYIKIGRTT